MMRRQLRRRPCLFDGLRTAAPLGAFTPDNRLVSSPASDSNLEPQRGSIAQHSARMLRAVATTSLALTLLLLAGRAAAIAETDCAQETTPPGPVNCIAPTIGDWEYGSARCNATYGPFADEDSALGYGVEQEYLKGSGCTWTPVDPGFWGTPEHPTVGPCGSTATFPQNACSSDSQPRVDCGIETTNWRNARISYQFGVAPQPCSAVAVDGMNIKRSRPVTCPSGSDFVKLESGTWLCRPRVEQSNLGKPCDCKAGNPINPAVGNKYQEETDYVGAGPFPLVFVRSYNSRAAADPERGLGAGWTSNYHARLTFYNDSALSSATAVRADGKAHVFLNRAGVWTPNSDVNDRLTQSANGWLLSVAKDDRVEAYDASGRLLSITDRAGLVQQLSYDAQGRLVAVRDPFGRQLTFGYDSDGHLSTMRDPDAQQPPYTFTFLNGNLATVSYPDGATRTYLYEDTRFPHALTGIVDENGSRYATWAYNSYGRANLSEHAGGVDHIEISYGLGDRLISSAIVKDERGIARNYSFDLTNRVARISGISPACDKCGQPSYAEFDANGNRTLVGDYNFNETRYTYDLQRNLQTQRIDASNVAALRRFTSTQWHPQFRLPALIAEPLRRTTLAYDDHGNLISKTIAATLDTNGALGFGATLTGATRTWTYSYTYSSITPGHVLRLVVDGPRTDVPDRTTYDWDEQGNLIAVANALGQVTTLGNYDPHGRPRLIVDANGLATALAYDARGRLISRNQSGEVTSYEYDAAGQLVRVTMPDASSLSYGYDAAHRLIQVQDNLGNRIAYTLDASGNRVQEQVFDPGQTLVRTHARAFDALDRLIQDIGGTNPATQITRYTYDNQGNVITVTDPLGHVTTNVYDALNRVKQVIDPPGTAANGITQYAYDGLDHITQVTDGRGAATGYSIDGLGNTTRLTSPDTGVTSSAYDAAGNLVSQLDPRGVSMTFTYDALNRVTDALYSPPAGSSIAPVTISYQYDVDAANPNAPERGRLTRINDTTGSTSFTHDIHGRLVAETRVIAGKAYVTGYSYDLAGRLTRLTYPSGRHVDYSFDALGRIAQIDTTDLEGLTQTAVAGVSYQPFGPVRRFTYGNASASARTFDADGRVVSYTLGTISRNVSYDDASRIIAFSHANASLDQSFLYDNLDRLSNWSIANTNRSFSYDVVGNRLSETIGAATYPYTYAALSNQLASVAGPSPSNYSYDAAGNVVGTGTKAFGYDARHRLIEATAGAQGATYQLNALGQRVMKTPTNGAATVYHYDAAGHLIAESDAQGNVQVEYIYLGDVPVAVLK